MTEQTTEKNPTPDSHFRSATYNGTMTESDAPLYDLTELDEAVAEALRRVRDYWEPHTPQRAVTGRAVFEVAQQLRVKLDREEAT
jgi:hypothetical protein